jgi:site-specific DNA-cytosine methylase
LFNYTAWLVDTVLTPVEQKRLAEMETFSFGEFCAGMGSGMMASEALRRSGIGCSGRCHCLTELSTWKQKFLQSQCDILKQDNAHIFKSTGDLAKAPCTDIHGKLHDLPVFDILFMGIVCVDISRLTSRPKSLMDASGASGSSFNQCLHYLDGLSFEQRPKALVLECVRALDQKRAVDGHTERGTAQAAEALAERGYAGKFWQVDARHFGLPAKRSRVWSLFLRCTKGLGPRAMAQRLKEAESAGDIIRRFQVSTGRGCLQELLERMSRGGLEAEPHPKAKPHPKEKQQKTPAKWPQRHQDFKEKH